MAGDAGGGVEVTPTSSAASIPGFPGDGGPTVEVLIPRWHHLMAPFTNLTGSGKD